jgi:hypothetical protein
MEGVFSEIWVTWVWVCALWEARPTLGRICHRDFCVSNAEI